MSSESPSSNSPPPTSSSSSPPQSSSAPPPPSLNSPPPQPNSPPPNPPLAPPPQPNPPPPTATPPPPQSPPFTGASSSPPPMASAPPPTSPPPPPTNAPSPSSPPPPVNTPPPSTPPPSTNAPPPSSPPPPVNAPPPSSPPPQPSTPPPTTSPPPPDPPTSPPPSTSSPPPPPTPTNNAPPPRPPPNTSPPPPSNRPPQNSPPPPPPAAVPPRSPGTPSVPSQSPPPPNSPSRPSPPPPSTASSPPPFSPPSLDPPGNPSTNNNAPESSSPSSGGGLGTGGITAIAIVSSLLLLGLFGILACCVWKRKKKPPGSNGGYIMPTSIDSSPKSGSSLLKVQVSSSSNNRSGSGNGIINSPRDGLGNSRSWFTYEELVEATNGFSDQNLLGKGGFGSVYKGSLADGREVAVKQLRDGGGQGEREFKSEVEIISRIHHRHLVSLVGYCISRERRLLVLDYLPNDTLYFHLHGEGRPVMGWTTRVKIAVGAARGLAYLHEDCHPRIIHRDIKSSNILLDSNFEARVSDFGLAKLAMDADTHISTRVMGTFGYMAPEYASSGKLTEKSDVFSFGVVLLELITGRKSVDTSQPLGNESLVEWARPLLSHAVETEEFEALADPRLDGNYVGGEMFRLIEVAAACVRHSSSKRPTMGQVVRAFDSMVTSDLTNGMKVGESGLYNSAEYSEEIRLFRRMAFGSHEYSTDIFSQNSSSSKGNGKIVRERERGSEIQGEFQPR